MLRVVSLACESVKRRCRPAVPGPWSASSERRPLGLDLRARTATVTAYGPPDQDSEPEPESLRLAMISLTVTVAGGHAGRLHLQVHLRAGVILSAATVNLSPNHLHHVAIRSVRYVTVRYKFQRRAGPDSARRRCVSRRPRPACS